MQKEEKEEGELCPYNKCGRRFVSSDQLKNHIERRHGGPAATAVAPSKPTVFCHNCKNKIDADKLREHNTQCLARS